MLICGEETRHEAEYTSWSPQVRQQPAVGTPAKTNSSLARRENVLGSSSSSIRQSAHSVLQNDEGFLIPLHSDDIAQLHFPHRTDFTDYFALLCLC
jgi:hypothetical protein